MSESIPEMIVGEPNQWHPVDLTAAREGSVPNPNRVPVQIRAGVRPREEFTSGLDGVLSHLVDILESRPSRFKALWRTRPHPLDFFPVRVLYRALVKAQRSSLWAFWDDPEGIIVKIIMSGVILGGILAFALLLRQF